MDKNQNEMITANDECDAGFLLPEECASGCAEPDPVRKKPRKNLLLLWAFLLPLGLMWLIYIAMEVWPFGNNSVLVLDLNGQYVYFFEELRSKLLSGSSLLYSWGRALGGEFMGIFAYYVASPFALITLLFPKGMITEALLTMILLKVGCCGLTMALYLKVAHPSKPINILIFSTMYALCSYSVVQAHNTMWIDELIFLPLVVLGIERLITRREFILYTASVAFCAMTNFYIGYMMCIFVAIYFFYYYIAHSENYENNLFEEDHHFFKSLLRIGIWSVVAIAIAMVVIYPAYYSLGFGKTTFTHPDYSFSQRFDFLDMIAKMFAGSYDTVRPEGLPFLYCGLLTLLLMPLYFIAPDIRRSEKIMTGVLIIIFILSFNGSTIDIFWHGMQKPNWLNYRYSFMLCFIFILCAYKAFRQIERIHFHYILSVAAILGVLLLIIQKQNYDWIDDIRYVWLNFAILGVLLCVLNPVCRRTFAETGKVILLITVSLELFISGLLDTISLDEDVVISSRTSYTSYMNKLQPMVDHLKAYDAEHFGSAFYRMEKNSHRKTNDPMALGFYGISNSTSTLNASVIQLLQKLGYSSKSHWAKYLGGSTVSDSLLAIKYVILTKETNERLLVPVEKNEEQELYSYYNPYALPLAYGVDPAVCELDISSYKSPFEFVNDLITAMLGEDEPVTIYKKITGVSVDYENVETTFTSGHKKYTPVSSAKDAKLIFNFTMPESYELFCFFPSEWKREAKLRVNGEDNGTFFANETYRIVSLGDHAKDEDMIVSLTLSDTAMYIATGESYFYYLDTDLFKEIYPRLSAAGMSVDSFEDTHITGHVDMGTDGGVLFTSIPYDEGWKVTADGQEVPLIKTLDSLLAVELTPGTHTLTFTYLPRCYVIGLCCSIAGITVFAAAITVYVLRRRKRSRIV